MTTENKPTLSLVLNSLSNTTSLVRGHLFATQYVLKYNSAVKTSLYKILTFSYYEAFYIFTVHNSSGGKIMFSQACVRILSTVYMHGKEGHVW